MAELSEDNSVEWEAAQWVARRMGDEPFDATGFETWLAGDPHRQVLFDTMWRHIMGPNMDEALTAYGQGGQSRRAWLAGGMAGLLALACAYKAWPAVELLITKPATFAAADGRLRQITLEDGTRLTLAGGANVRVRYTGHDRVVELARGTIFADVAHDESRPFRVDAGDARIVDLGTRFEISSKPSYVRLTVASGAVRLGTQGWFGKRLDLSADQAAVLTGKGLSRLGNVKPADVARWRDEWVEYHETPMWQVVRDIESTSPLPIRIAGKALANLRVSGRIRLTDPTRQVDNLAAIHDFSVVRRDGAIILSDEETGSSLSAVPAAMPRR